MDIDSIPAVAGQQIAPAIVGKIWNDWLGTSKKVGEPPKADQKFITLAKLINAEAELQADNCDGFKAKFWTFVGKFQGALEAGLIQVIAVPPKVDAPAEVQPEVVAKPKGRGKK